MSDSHPFNLTDKMYTTTESYPEFVARIAKPMGSFAADLHHMGTGIATEAGEFLSTTKKIWVYGQGLDTKNKEGQTNKENAIEELGDLLYYVQGACNLLNIGLYDLIDHNRKKLEKRYPSGYSDAAALQRADKIVTVEPSGESPITGLVGKLGE